MNWYDCNKCLINLNNGDVFYIFNQILDVIICNVNGKINNLWRTSSLDPVYDVFRVARPEHITAHTGLSPGLTHTHTCSHMLVFT